MLYISTILHNSKLPKWSKRFNESRELTAKYRILKILSPKWLTIYPNQ